VLLASLSCSRQPTPTLQRLAVLRFENLSGDISLDWMGRAAPEVVAFQLTGGNSVHVITLGTLHGFDRMLGARPASAPGISTELSEAMATGATRVLYGQISRPGDRLHIDATLYDARTQHVERTEIADGPAAGGILPLADSLVRKLGRGVRPFDTRSEIALREYALALEAADAAKTAEALAGALAADPNFGAAYLGQARLAIGQRNTAEAERILALARSRGDAVAELDRARLAAVAAGLHNSASEVVSALETLSRLTPADPALYRELAQANLNRRQFSAAVAGYQKAAALQPDEPILRNQLAYAQVYAGDLEGALQSLKRYAALRPSEANPLDSMGDVYYAFGRFAEAEKSYKDAQAKDPNFAANGSLLKAAHARLATGDIAGADTAFGEYAQARIKAKDAMVEYRRAEWEYLSGRRKAALDRLEAYATAMLKESADRASQAYSQLAIWNLSLGDRARARAFAAKAAASAGPISAGIVAVTRFLCDPPPSHAALAQQAERLFPDARQTRMKNLATIYALLYGRDYAGAAPLLQEIFDHSAPTPEESVPVLLAWAHIEAKQTQEAVKLLARNPVPNATAVDLFTFLYYPRFFFLKAEALRQSGQREDAARNYRLFLQLSGPTAEVFGDEQRAREALGGN
jgi:tetratricopeptide (TPR) repeat protein/TolB-like protein